MLATKITNLASLWKGTVTGWILAADKGIEMSERFCAVSVGGYWRIMYVID